MQLGIYEQLITKALKQKLDSLPSERYFIETRPVDKDIAARYLSQHLTYWIEYALNDVLDKDRPDLQFELANRLLQILLLELRDASISDELLLAEKNLLEAIFTKADSNYPDLGKRLREIMPYTRLTQSELFTGSRASIPLESELRKEIASANELCWIVSFIRFSGIRIFKKELEEFVSGTTGRKIRILTTTYMGTTEAKAVEYLASLPNTDIRISFNATRERLHAKAYLFLRDSGFHTGYIGSSNLSRSALTNGLEWNLKVTSKEIPHIIDKFQKTFESYWNDPDFEPYKKNVDLERLNRSLNASRNQDTESVTSFYDIKPHLYQEEILSRLQTERELHGRFRNLIVAATGTGKTLISAFDFKRFRDKYPNAKLLFVAHRKEILQQARQAFRQVFKDQNFGELLVDGIRPTQVDAVFASVQSLNNQNELTRRGADFYDYIVVDEVHHISASSYRPILKAFNPKILLGLTATPERNDGEDILIDFDDHIAAEIRLPEALNRQLLCPFQYFGISDSIDLSHVNCVNGKYDVGELTRIYTKSDQRVSEIIDNCNRYLTDIQLVRALCFCISQEHAKYMAEKFTLAGLRADYLTGTTERDERERIRKDLRAGKINYLFVVDVFNEGVDIPEVDTVLFLRPTESLTIFLQQLGRGLRLAENKMYLTVLDFVGNARVEYDFEKKFRALIGKTHSSVKDEIENEFPHLPLGCSIVLEKQAKEHILANIRAATSLSRRKLVQKIRSFGNDHHLELTLANFLTIHSLQLVDVYQRDSWSRLCVEAGVRPDFQEADEKRITAFIERRLLTTQSYHYFKFLKTLIEHGFIWSKHDATESLYAMMVYYDLYSSEINTHGYTTLESSLHILKRNPTMLEEIRDVINLLIDRIDIIEKPVDLGYPFPLHIHGRYNRDQILSALRLHKFDYKKPSREGIINAPDLNTEALFVTLSKNDEMYSPTTMYKDYALSPFMFNWESQNRAAPDNASGLSYINHKKTEKKILLFVRESNNDLNGYTVSFVFLGPVEIDNYHGARPMSIEWKLSEPIPEYLLIESKKLVAS